MGRETLAPAPRRSPHVDLRFSVADRAGGAEARDPSPRRTATPNACSTNDATPPQARSSQSSTVSPRRAAIAASSGASRQSARSGRTATGSRAASRLNSFRMERASKMPSSALPGPAGRPDRRGLDASLAGEQLRNGRIDERCIRTADREVETRGGQDEGRPRRAAVVDESTRPGIRRSITEWTNAMWPASSCDGTSERMRG